MKKRSLLMLGMLLLCSISYTQQISRISVYFDTDQHLLRADASNTLQNILHELETLTLEDYQVEVEAHTDSRGTDVYNVQLAERRAQSVRNFLTAKGIQIQKTTVRAYGEQNPSFSNEDEEGRQKNRRVDVIITYFLPQTLDELFADWSNEQTQHFVFDPNKAVKIQGKEGTTIWIDADLFEVADGGGLPSGKIHFELREAYSMEAMIMSDLTTSSGDELLETGGMLFTNATDEKGRKLAIKQGKNMQVAMPTPEFQEGMELFTGIQNENGQLNDWNPVNQPAENGVEVLLNLPPKPKAPALIQKPVYLRYEKELGNLDAKPKAPRKPYKPGKPKEPKKEEIVYKPPFFKGLFMSRSTKERKREALYQQALSNYKIEMKTYDKRQVNYESAWTKYEEKYALYQEELSAWQLEYENAKNSKVLVYEDVAAREANKELREAHEAKKAAYKKRMDAWKEFRTERFAAFEERYESMGNVRMNEGFLDQYIFQVNHLGWINCDRFYNVPNSMKEHLVINDRDATPEKVFVIVKDFRSMIRASYWNKKYKTDKIPRGTAVRIVSIKLDKGKPFLAMKDTHVGQEFQVALDYKACTLGELRKSLTELN